MMGRGSASEPSTIGPTDFHQFFDAKVAGVRASTADAPPPTFTEVDPGCSFTQFEMLTVEDVADAIRALPDKQCSSDPIATRMVKETVDVLAPFCTELFNRSLTTGSVPSSFKAASVTPLLKKVSLDPADVSSYRPNSNLSVMSKLLERLVAKQLVGYLTACGLLPRLQSAYRAHHWSETAVLKVMTDILRELDIGNLAVVTLLDLSAAFDTVYHATLLRRLSVTYGLTVPCWAGSGPTSAAVRSSSSAAPLGRLQRLCYAVSRRARSLDRFCSCRIPLIYWGSSKDMTSFLICMLTTHISAATHLHGMQLQLQEKVSRRQHEDSCLEGGVWLLRRAAPTPQHSFVGYEAGLCVACRVTGVVSP